ncbi:hypothetical protein SAMN05421538_11813 [Paracoccus isoporae]|uniref:Uncharacterized protein n=1 Tax=Paracoccus isoporae TaxID=591205 RepID=A0A1G7H7P6_9RHOB|nr:hypothetical protein [Paracoccus isoporae]SDE96438.1 hypothetical protein SAMN05421538_11813 [Paracoccus isoporae]
MGMIETASRIIKRFGQTATFERPGESGGTPWDPEPGTPTFHTAIVAVVDYEQEHRDGTLIQANDLRVLVSVVGLDIVPNLADRLTIGGAEYSIANVTPLAPDGTVRMYDLQVRR